MAKNTSADKSKTPMKVVRQILKYKYLTCFSNTKIAEETGVSHQTVGRSYKRALAAGLTWSRIKEIDDDELEICLFPNALYRKSNLIRPDCAALYKRLNSSGHDKAKLKKEDLWHEFFIENGISGVARTTFFNDLRAYESEAGLSMTQFKAPGDYLFVDIAGSKVYIGKNKDIPTSVFAGAFGHSDLAFMNGYLDESQISWMRFMERVFVSAQGVPVFVVTDNAAALRTNRKNAKKITSQYEMLSTHYDFIPFDIPPRTPQYNYRAERTVRKFVDRILLKAKELTFIDLDDFNKWLQAQVDEINARVSKKTHDSAFERFLVHEKPALRALNPKKFSYPHETHMITVQKDYKFEHDGVHYSIPKELYKQKVKVIISENEVEMRCKNKIVCIHTRLKNGDTNSMKPEHMPENHRVLVTQNKAYFVEWASGIDEAVVALVEAQFKGSGEPDYKGREACLKLQGLAKKGEFDKYVETAQWIVSLGRLTVTAFADALEADVTNKQRLQEAYVMYQKQNQHNSGGTHYVH